MDVVRIDYSTGRSDGKRRRERQRCAGCAHGLLRFAACGDLVGGWRPAEQKAGDVEGGLKQARKMARNAHPEEGASIVVVSAGPCYHLRQCGVRERGGEGDVK